MRGRSMLLAVAVLLAAAPGAGAAPTVGVRTYALTVSPGSLTVTFHGDAAAGCADRGVCDTSGTITATLDRPAHGFADLTAFGHRIFGNGSVFDPRTTRAEVHAGSATCTDEVATGADAFVLLVPGRGRPLLGYGSDVRLPEEQHGGTINFGSSSAGDVFATRCGGPLLADLTPALPRLRLPRSVLLRPRLDAHLTGTRSFRAAGFAGTVTADVRLAMRRRPCPSHGSQGAMCRRFATAVRRP